MAQFQVPQYIDVEDKIVGPLTLKQFLYLASGFLFIFITYFFFAPWLWIFTAAIVGSAAVAFALVKYNGRSLTTLVGAALRYLWRPRIYTWQKPGSVSPARGRIGGLLSRLGLQLDTATHFKRIFKRIIPPQQQFEILRRVTGDREVAKRVDYR